MENKPDWRPDPVTPSISEVRSEQNQRGTRKVEMRAEIDTSTPFGSVKEAVTRFGGSGSWNPYYKAIGEIDIKKVEELAAELEKDLIVKELETLDVLEELGTTKGIVEELKQQIRKEAVRRMALVDEQQMTSPAIKEMNKENCSVRVNNGEGRMRTVSPHCTDTPDAILMELKQAKLNLGKTITDLGVIQSSVESLNKKMKKEKNFLEKAVKSLTSKFAGVLSLEEELKQARFQPRIAINQETGHPADQLKRMIQPEQVVEVTQTVSVDDQKNMNLNTAELRLFAARKMEEAARAAEAVALAEIKAMTGNEGESSPMYVRPELEKVPLFDIRSPLTPRAQKLEGVPKMTELIRPQNREANATKMTIMKRLREVAEEVKQSKQALEEAMNKVEMVNKKQFAVEEALSKWIPEDDQEKHTTYYTHGFCNSQFPELNRYQDSPLTIVKDSNLINANRAPVLRSTTSMRDVLSKKQVVQDEHIAARPTEGRGGRQKVALSQMLHELRGNATFQPRVEKERTDHKQYFAQRRKFGFIHISLPMKQSKKKMSDLNTMN